MAGFYPSAVGTTTCISCTSQIANCASCQNNTGTFQCTSCLPDFVWTGSSCLSCIIHNCLTLGYTSSTCFCATCAPYYVSTGPTCLACTKINCITTGYISGQCQCAQCDSGYAPDANGDCNLCSSYIPNCLLCSSPIVCLSCDHTV